MNENQPDAGTSAGSQARIGAGSDLQATSAFEPTAGPGAVINGRYRLVEKIGEGGMGEVWVAKQDEPVKRKVAVKLIKPGMDSKAVLARFEQERQALAMMDHPSIAKVLDGGLTADRRPFFVMELVSGAPLTTFCDEAKLGVRERLELFVPLCQAVQHAHQKGIIHRDLKPSNVLVTLYDGKPVPKVIDFGVAKATGGKLTDESMSTQFGAVVGTLEYMAPEQAGMAAQDVDTRADVYALGVILYELLTGMRPFDGKRLKHAAILEVARILREEDPPKPSTRMSSDAGAPSFAALRRSEPKRLTLLLRGELDWVVMKCLEKDRNRRYETANGLARDVQRYLADEPIEARPPSGRYRLRKFLRRNRGPVVAASLVLSALLAGIAGTTWGLVEARRQRQVAVAEAAEKETQRALAQEETAEKERQRGLAQDEAVEKERQAKLARQRRDQSIKALSLFANDFGLFCEDALVPSAKKAKLYEVLVKQLESQAIDDTPAASADECFNKARMYQTLAIAYLDTSQPAKAREIVDKGLATVDRWLAAKPGDPYVLSYQAVFISLRADTETGVPEKARASYLEALKLRRAIAGRTEVDQFTPGRSLMQLADTLDRLQQSDESIKLREQVVEIQSKAGVETDKLFESLDFWCRSCWLAYTAPGDKGKRVGLLDKADELSRRVLKTRPGSRRTLDRWSQIARELVDRETALATLAEATEDDVEERRRTAAARRHFQDLTRITRELATSRDLMYARSEDARSHYYLGELEDREGNFDEARANHLVALNLREQLVRDFVQDGWISNLRIDLGFSLAALGRHREAAAAVAAATPNWARTEALLYRAACVYDACIAAVEIARRPRELTPEDKQLQAGYAELALSTLSEMSRLGDSSPGVKDDFGQHDPNIFPRLRGDPRYEVVVERIKKFKGTRTDPAMAEVLKAIKSKPDDVQARREFARIFVGARQWRAASVALRKVAELAPQMAKSHADLGHALCEAGEHDEAMASLRRALELDPADAAAGYDLGLALLALGRLEEARERLHQAHDLGSRQPGWAHPSAEKVKEIDRLVELEQQLPAVLRGERKPSAPEEMFEVCRLTHRDAAAAHVFDEALRLKPAFADDLRVGRRYTAARLALRASGGLGENAGDLDAAARARLRRLALGWLQAELGAYDQLALGDRDEGRALVVRRLRGWKRDLDLAGTRSDDALNAFPESEANAWRNLWADVGAAIHRAVRAAGPEPAVDEPAVRFKARAALAAGDAEDAQVFAALPPHRRCRVYAFRMIADRKYQIDMAGTEINPYLRLRDPAGKDLPITLSPVPGSQNARLVYVADRTGDYEIVATQMDTRFGKYTLTVTDLGVPRAEEMLIDRARNINVYSAADRRRILASLARTYAARKDQLDGEDAALAYQVCLVLDGIANEDLIGFCATVGQLMAGAAQPEVANAGKTLEGMARRFGLMGNEMTLQGREVNGTEFDLRSYRGRVVLVEFWATWCSPCVTELPDLKKLHKTYHDRGFEVVGVNLDQAMPTLAAFLEREKLPWTNIVDKGGGTGLSQQFGIYTIPTCILVGRDGRVVSLNARGAELHRLLEELLPNKP